MKDFLFKAGVFIKLIDAHDGQLSMTSLALWVVLVKIALLQQASAMDLTAFALALISYQGKKIINQASASTDTDPMAESLAVATADIESLKSKVTTLALSVGLKTKG